MMYFFKLLTYISLMVIFAFTINAQMIPVEKRLIDINVILTEINSHEEIVRDWLLTDPAFKKLADNVLKVIDKRKVMNIIPLEVINGKYKLLLGKRQNEYVTADKYDNLDLIKKAIYKTWKERHINSHRNKFNEILIETKEKSILDKKNNNTFISIEIDVPKELNEIAIPQFVGKGRVVSYIELIKDTYIYSCIKIDKYYRQDSQKLKFSKIKNQWIANWELEFTFGRSADIGLEGILHFFVVDKTNRKKLIKYYMYPTKDLHSFDDIQSIYSLKLPIERSIPE